jgi:hypothetical protein
VNPALFILNLLVYCVSALDLIENISVAFDNFHTAVLIEVLFLVFNQDYFIWSSTSSEYSISAVISYFGYSAGML